MALLLGWGKPALLRTLRPSLTIHFLDVGQGDAAFVQFPNGRQMLVDAGGASFGDFDVGEQALWPFLRWLRVSRIDYMMLTHPHPDHYGGFLAVLRRLPVGEFWHNGQRSRHPRFRQLRRLLQSKGVRLRSFGRYRRFSIGKVSVEILHPLPGPYEGKTYYWVLGANDNSLVMRLTYGRIRVLFTGDIERRGEKLLCQKWPKLRADILKVPHHGSRTSSSALLLDRVRPRYAVVSAGRHNRYGFPHPEVLRRYRERKIHLWQIHRSGYLRARIDGKTISWEAYRSP